MTYYEKLKDPRWQRKRLEILSRDNFTCQHCSNDKNTLHVHHLSYLKFLDPWDYDLKYLVTLCDECHKKEEEKKEAVRIMIESLILSCQTINPLYNILNEKLNG